MQQPDTYPVPMEQEQLATYLGFFNPAAPPTDAQRMEAAQMVDGWQQFKRTGYWMHLEKIVKRDLRRSYRQQRRKHYSGTETTPTRAARTVHYRSPYCYIVVPKRYAKTAAVTDR